MKKTIYLIRKQKTKYMKQLLDKYPVKFLLVGMATITIIVHMVAFMCIRPYQHDTPKADKSIQVKEPAAEMPKRYFYITWVAYMNDGSESMGSLCTTSTVYPNLIETGESIKTFNKYDRSQNLVITNIIEFKNEYDYLAFTIDRKKNQHEK